MGTRENIIGPLLQKKYEGVPPGKICYKKYVAGSLLYSCATYVAVAHSVCFAKFMMLKYCRNITAINESYG